MYTAFHLRGGCIAVGNLTIFQYSVSQKTQSGSKAGVVTSLCAPACCDTQNSARSSLALVWAPWAAFIAALGFQKVSGQAGAAEDLQWPSSINKQLNSMPLPQKGSQSVLPKKHKPVQMWNHWIMEYPEWEFWHTPRKIEQGKISHICTSCIFNFVLKFKLFSQEIGGNTLKWWPSWPSFVSSVLEIFIELKPSLHTVLITVSSSWQGYFVTSDGN